MASGGVLLACEVHRGGERAGCVHRQHVPQALLHKPRHRVLLADDPVDGHLLQRCAARSAGAGAARSVLPFSSCAGRPLAATPWA